MKPAPFEYRAPTSVAETVGLLTEYGEDAKLLAGGQSLMPLLALRLARPTCLIDLGRVEGRRSDAGADGGNGKGNGGGDAVGITADANGVHISAMVRQRVAERDATLRAQAPLFAEAIPFIGHTAIRNRGTIGGSVAHADPAAELPTASVAAGATFVVTGPAGEREIAADDFFVSYLTTALRSDELLTGIRLPAPLPRTGWSFVEFSRRHGDFAIVAVAAGVRLDGAGRIADVRLALAGVGSTPVRAVAAEASLAGGAPSDEAWAAAAEAAAQAVTPPADLHGSSVYRSQLVRVLARRGLATAAERATAGGQ